MAPLRSHHPAPGPGRGEWAVGFNGDPGDGLDLPAPNVAIPAYSASARLRRATGAGSPDARTRTVLLRTGMAASDWPPRKVTAVCRVVVAAEIGIYADALAVSLGHHGHEV